MAAFIFLTQLFYTITMARKNKLGTSYCSLGLEKSEESILKNHLQAKGWSAKRYLRYLIRQDLKINPQHREKERSN